MKTLENQLKLYLRFYAFVGLFPFKITDKKLVPSTTLKIYGIIQIIILSSAVTTTVIADLHLAKPGEDAIRLICYVFTTITIATTVIVSISKSRGYCSMFHKFNKVECHFHYLGISTREQSNAYQPLKFLLVELFLFAILVASEYISPYWIQNLSFYSVVYYWFAVLVMSFGSVNCQVYAYLISTRYTIINSKLESVGEKMESHSPYAMQNKITDDNPNDNLKTFATKAGKNIFTSGYGFRSTPGKELEITADIKLLQKCHYELYGICSTLIEMFSYPIILFLFVTACSLLFICFTGLDKILNSANVDVLEVLNCLKYSAYNLYRVVYILKAFTSIQKSGNATAYHVQGIMLKTDDPELRGQLQYFAQQLHHHKLHFSTSGFFSLDMSLLVSMTGAITTYLVILLELPGTKHT